MSIADALKNAVIPFDAAERGFDSVIGAARGKNYVLLGEASHGTQEFYRIRADITRRLIEEEGFDAVAVEADWPDAWRVNRYVRGMGSDKTAEEALSDFRRFPLWMWRNEEVRAFIDDLRRFNEKSDRAAGFYGLDLYSMGTSIAAVIAYLDAIDPKEGAAARERYGCFGHFHLDPQMYGYASATERMKSCEDEVVAQLLSLREKTHAYAQSQDLGAFSQEAAFAASQNAELIKHAEAYYRALYQGNRNTWNMRDRYMFQTLTNISAHLEKQLRRKPRIVVWAHNSHLGDAAATEMGWRGDINLGQLTLERYRAETLNIGFSTSRGTVSAASEWDGPCETKNLRAPLQGSYERIFSNTGIPRFIIDLRQKGGAVAAFSKPRLERAIGVIYRPESERTSHYFDAILPDQFDMMIHLEETRALTPLADAPVVPRGGDMDETYPYGL